MTPAAAVAVALEAPTPSSAARVGAPAPPSMSVAATAQETTVGAAMGAPTQSSGGGGGGCSERRSRFRRICVYCGSAKGNKHSYQDAAIDLGKQLVERGIDLVYGGGSIGLMGLVSHAVHAGGRHVIGIIPKSLMPREVTGDPVGEVRAVSGMHERKAEMARFADAFIALPGFITEEARRIIISAPTAKELVVKLEDYVPEYDIGLVWEDQKQNSLVPELESKITLS
nr:unnamed protein product [Digitaria exilis]